jgi:hypothetical protein
MERDRERIVVTIRPGLQITQSCFRVGARHFELANLHNLHVRQSAHDPLTRNAAIIAGGVTLGLLLLGRFMHPAGVIAGGVVLAGLVMVVGASARTRPRRQELWAVYYGHEIPIFASDDHWLFGAVERQVRRSMTEVHNGRRYVTPTARTESLVPHPSQMHPSNMNIAI